MNVKQIIDNEELLVSDIDNDITFKISDKIFIYDENNDVTINYFGTVDDFYQIDLFGEVVSK